MKPDELEKRDTGRKGYLEPDEPPDGIRRRINYRPIRRDESERLTYEHAVETHPKRPDEGPMAYIQRIAGIVEKRLGPVVQAMPKELMTRREFQRRLAELEKQRPDQRAGGAPGGQEGAR